MPYRGHLENGVVKPDEAFPWSDGTEVVVEPVEPVRSKSIAERFQNIIGVAKDLPSDMAKNHDHYIHGTPKQ